jgi:predicted nucleic acid-binding protein
MFRLPRHSADVAVSNFTEVAHRSSSQDGQALAHKVRPMFEQRVLPVMKDILFKWRLLVEDGRQAGYTFSQTDLIIAATALQHGLTVVSRDTSDYERARVPVLIPWKRIASDTG